MTSDTLASLLGAAGTGLEKLFQGADVVAGGVLPEEVAGGFHELGSFGDKLRQIKEESRSTIDDHPLLSFLKGAASSAYDMLIPQSPGEGLLEVTPLDEIAPLLGLAAGGKRLGKTLDDLPTPKAKVREGYAHGAQGSVEENFREAAGVWQARVDRSGNVQPLPKGIDAKATSGDAVVQINADGSVHVLDGEIMSYQQEQALHGLKPREAKDIGESVVHELVDEGDDATAEFLRELGVAEGGDIEKLRGVIKPGTAKPGSIKVSKDQALDAIASTERMAGSKRAAKDLPIPEVKVPKEAAEKVIKTAGQKAAKLSKTDELLGELQQTIIDLPNVVARLTRKKEFRGVDPDILAQGLRDEIENEARKLGAPMDEVEKLLDNSLSKMKVNRPAKRTAQPDKVVRELDPATRAAMGDMSDEELEVLLESVEDFFDDTPMRPTAAKKAERRARKAERKK
jgi:hypothetical protein